jgi:predicted MPP superfamily phosphohydrolase
VRIFLFLFILLSAAVLAGAHVYFYRRLVRDVTSRPRGRRVSVWSFSALGMAALLARPLTFYLPDLSARPIVLGVTVWIGTAMYLFLVLGTLDLARLAYFRFRRGGAPDGAVAAEGSGPYRAHERADSDFADRAGAQTDAGVQDRASAPVADAAEEPERGLAGPVDPARRLVLARGLAAVAVTTTGGLSAWGLHNAFAAPEITEVPVRLPGLPKALDGYSIVQLTDIHVGSVIQEAFLKQLVEVANSAKPDAMVITGDLVDGTVARLGRFVALLQGLRARDGVHFVTGNHDHYSGATEWCAALEGLGFNVIRNRGVALGDRNHGGQTFDLFGVDDYQAARNGEGRYDLTQALAGRDPHRASVLLAHQPRDRERVAAEGIGLMISGHTHGGQMFPGNLVGDLVWGRHNAGLANIGDSDSQLFVSRGCGFVGPPFRVGAAPEVVKLVLLAA